MNRSELFWPRRERMDWLATQLASPNTTMTGRVSLDTGGWPGMGGVYTEELLGKPHAKPFEMRGRQMDGWLRVDAEGVKTKRDLEPWVKRGVGYARSLPPKG